MISEIFEERRPSNPYFCTSVTVQSMIFFLQIYFAISWTKAPRNDKLTGTVRLAEAFLARVLVQTPKSLRSSNLSSAELRKMYRRGEDRVSIFQSTLLRTSKRKVHTSCHLARKSTKKKFIFFHFHRLNLPTAWQIHEHWIGFSCRSSIGATPLNTLSSERRGLPKRGIITLKLMLCKIGPRPTYSDFQKACLSH